MNAGPAAQAPPATSPCAETQTQGKRPPLWLVLSAFAAVYLICGSTYVGIRLAIDSMPPLLMSGGRFLLAGVALYTVMRLGFNAPRPELGHWKGAFIIGAALLLVGNGGVSWAEQTAPTNLVALIIAGTPLWIILIDWLRPGGKQPHWLVFPGLLLGFSGVGLIVLTRDPLGRSVLQPAGAAVLLAASFCWAAGSVYSRHARQSGSALLAVAMQMISGGLLLLLAGSAFGEWRGFNPREITSQSAAAFLYLTLFGSLIGFTAYVWLLQVSTPARVATYAYVNPLIAVFLGWVALDERLPGSIVTAGALILGAVALITTRGRGTSGNRERALK